MPLTDDELYDGYTQEQIRRYKEEAEQRFDPALVAESNRRLHKLSKEEWLALKAEGEEIAGLLAGVMDRSPDDAEVQELIARHHAHIERFYPCDGKTYVGLGQLYMEHADFRAHYDRYRPGLADFLKEAMEWYAENRLGDS
ncbi:TipAS antibiotic-recognition domain-containing protein [Candidatus Neomarinimicrobiota bacterium]